MGKTVTDELAYSLSGTNVHYGTPTNVRCPDRVPGGSSSGSASAVAGGAADIGLGTDTGGSIRIPSSYCGLVGFRPTHGAVDTTGVIPLSPSYDTVGWMTTNVAKSGGRLNLEMYTTASTAVSSSYLAAWYQQGPQADLPSQATLQRIADSIMVTSEAELAAQRDVAQANVAGQPVLASAETSIWLVDLYGEGRFLQLCVRRPAEPAPRCATETHGGQILADGTGLATAEWTIAGEAPGPSEWLTTAASTTWVE